MGSLVEVVDVTTAGRGGAAANGRVGSTGRDANAPEILARKASYGSAGGGGGGADEAGVVGAETAGTGPDVTRVVAVVEAAMREVWEDVEEGRPSEDEGNLSSDCPKLVEDTVASSP